MTKDEIKALIASKLAGQGTNIDAASVLPAILEGIIDLIPTLPEPYELPIATGEVLGGVKVGDTLSINEEGVLNASAMLIVNGGVSDGRFQPHVGEPSLQDSISAILNGKNVVLYDTHGQQYYFPNYVDPADTIQAGSGTNIVYWSA